MRAAGFAAFAWRIDHHRIIPGADIEYLSPRWTTGLIELRITAPIACSIDRAAIARPRNRAEIHQWLQFRDRFKRMMKYDRMDAAPGP